MGPPYPFHQGESQEETQKFFKIFKNHRHRSWYSDGDMPTCFLKVLPK